MKSLRIFLLLLTMIAGPLAFLLAEEDQQDSLKWGSRQVHPTRLVAKLKPEGTEGVSIKEIAQTLKALANRKGMEGETITAPFRTFRELVLVDVKENVANDTSPDQGISRLQLLKKRQQALLKTGLFEYVEPDWVVTLQRTPSDSGLSNGDLWGLRNSGQSGGTSGIDIQAESAWDITTGSRNVVVGVIDTGVRYTHQDLAANIWQNPGEIPGNGVDDDGNGFVDDVFGINAINRSGDPMDDNGHGTHIAGTIGAVANGGGPHVGVAWDVQIMGLKFLSARGSGSNSDAIRCIDYAIAEGADILSNSWGGGGSSNALRDAVVRARQAGILFVAAAGNEARDNDQSPSYPANIDVDNVISVASITRTGSLSGFSNYGRKTVDLAAPGSDIYSTWHTADNAYRTISGTSMATPHVAGVAALLKAQFPGEPYTSIKQRIMESATPLASLQGRMVTGGMLNARQSLEVAADGTLEVSLSGTELPLPVGQNFPITIRVTDFTPVLGATVTASHTGQSPITFQDSGQNPDSQANDGIYTATYPVPASGSELSLNVSVTKSGKTPFNNTFPLAIVERPANDNFANALETIGTVSTGSNLYATSESGEPRNPNVAGGSSVWWSWTAPTGGSTVITTEGSNFDTTLAVYQGTTLQNLSVLASNDDSNGRQSAVSFNAISGVTYWVQVDGYNGATGTIFLNHPNSGSVDPAPRILQQPQGGTVVEGNNYTFTVIATGDGLSYQWLKDGASLPGETGETLTLTNVTESQQGRYSVRVQNSFGTATSNEAFLSVDQVTLLPDNDNLANAFLLEGLQGRVAGDNRDATGELNEPDHLGRAATLQSLWFEWASTTGGVLTVTTDGSSFDTILAVYTGSSMNTLTLQTSDDDSGEGLRSRVVFNAEPGISYWIATDGYQNSSGDLLLSHTFVPTRNTVSADSFASRQPLIGSFVQGSNVNASGEQGEPDHAGGSQPLESIWWYWTAPQNGLVTFDTIGSDFDTTLGVYVGNAVNALTTVASNDDASGRQSRVQFQATVGTTYSIAVDGYASREGNIQLNVDFIADDGNQYEFDPNFGSLLFLADNRYFNAGYGTLAFAGGGVDRGWAWSSSLQVWLQGFNQSVSSPLLGNLQTGADPLWVFSDMFGWIHFGFDDQTYGGWIFSELLGWMAFVWGGDQAFLYAPTLGNTWTSVQPDGTFLNTIWGRMIPLGDNVFQSSTFGLLTTGGDGGWVYSNRYGWCWPNGREWVWSEGRQEWLGVTPDGGVWSSRENRFL